MMRIGGETIGIAGMYIGHIYHEVKRRPMYHPQDVHS